MSKNRGQSMARRASRSNEWKITSKQAARAAQGRGNGASGNMESFFNTPTQVEDNDE